MEVKGVAETDLQADLDEYFLIPVPPPDAFTLLTIMERYGFTAGQARTRIDHLINRGKIEKLGIKFGGHYAYYRMVK